MAQLIVRNLDDDVKRRLQERARRHGRSAEAEVREILRDAVRPARQEAAPLGTRLSRRFARVGLGTDIAEWRGTPARPANFRR